MGQVALIICGGIHPLENTQQMLADMSQYRVFDSLPKVVHPRHNPLESLSAWSLRRCLRNNSDALIFLAFSAGCLAAASAARYWHDQANGQVLALLAIDGWGIPLIEPFPVHRLSHDRFTHDTSTRPGIGHHFYADPAVDHLRIWQTPSQVYGRATGKGSCTAAAFIDIWLKHYLQQYKASRIAGHIQK